MDKKKSGPRSSGVSDQPAERVLHELEELDEDFEYVNWQNSPVQFPGLVRIRTIQGVDCVYHAILNALSVAYRSHELHGVEMNEKTFVRGLRRELAVNLSNCYDTLNGGKIKDMVLIDPSVSLEELQRQIISCGHIPKVLLPFVCDELNCDIYFVSGHNRDVFPALVNMREVIKDRRSVVLVYSRNHYELMGLVKHRKNTRGHKTVEYVTVFSPKHEFILQLKAQLGM